MFTNTSLILEHRRHHFTRQQLGGSILIPKYTALNEVAQVRPLKHSQNTNNRTILSKLSLMSSQHEILAHFTSVMTPIHELNRISTRKKNEGMILSISMTNGLYLTGVWKAWVDNQGFN